ncbi:MAG: PHP domain-containing protein [Candidatus Thorarchaeota archaeon]|nr:PHP domain-containing protein [Candidatus Thorarchaeota archaeon]
MKTVTHDLHTHSDFSDGVSTVEEIVAQAQRVGLKTVAITDHFWPSLGSKMGAESLVEERSRVLSALRDEQRGLRILGGAEVDIETNGSLCPVAGGLEQFDIVIGSVHAPCRSEVWVSALCKVVRSNHIDILAHWDGYLTSYRMEDGERAARALSDAGVAVELSARYPTRDEGFLVLARDAGCEFALGSDSHSATTVGRLQDQLRLAEALALPLLDR